MPLKHNPGIILPKRDELLGFTPIVLMVVFYMSTALLLYYGSLNRIAELYLPFIFVHVSLFFSFFNNQSKRNIIINYTLFRPAK
jgi:hypothetical protein